MSEVQTTVAPGMATRATESLTVKKRLPLEGERSKLRTRISALEMRKVTLAELYLGPEAVQTNSLLGMLAME